LLIAVYYLLPGLRPGIVAAIGALSLTAIIAGTSWFHPQRWGGWYLIAAAVALLSLGDVMFTALAAASTEPPPFPGTHDLFYVAAYPPLALGMLYLGQHRLPSRDWPMVVDSAALSLAGGLLLWVTLVRPAVVSHHLSGSGITVAVLSWVGYVAVLATSARVLVAWRTNSAVALLSAGVAAYLVADFFYGRELVAGRWNTGSLIDLGYLGFSVLCGAAALTTSMNNVASASYARHQLGPVRLSIVAAALLAAPTVLLAEATEGPVTTAVAVGLVSAQVGVLVLWRLAMVVRAYQRQADRERTVRDVTRDLVLAATEADVTTSLLDGLRDLLPLGSRTNLRLVETVGDTARVELSPVDTAHERRGRALGELIAPASPPRSDQPRPRLRCVVFTAPIAELVELEALLSGLADQAGSALHRIQLTDELHAQERERYFRTLVLTSDDVTLISRGGRVVYATPSAWSMFGRDVTGESSDELIQAEPPQVVGDAPPAADVTAELNGVDGYVRRHDRVVEARCRTRDLTDDPSVHGEVTTLRDITAERQLERDLAFRASHDPLTGLANARLFHDELYAAGTRGHTLRGNGEAVLFVDLDDFKTVNDTYGHHMGDELLAEVGRRITACLRQDDLAARLGGDEFAILLRHLTDVETAAGVAQRVVETLSRPVRLGADDVTRTASVGLAYTEERGDFHGLLHEADTALYRAKASGKSGLQIFRDDGPETGGSDELPRES
jgi:diguanylate cyclase (GGDEF)-like protein